MAIYVAEINIDFNTEHYPPHCGRQCVRCKQWRDLAHCQRYCYANAGRYLVQYKSLLPAVSVWAL